MSFTVGAFADLDDGRRVTLHPARGFTSWLHSTAGREPADPWSHLTAESIESGVRTTVQADEDETEDEHPWQWLAGLLRTAICRWLRRQHGVEASVDRG